MLLIDKTNMDGTHVVFGATGAYGYSVIRKLVEKRCTVRAVVRDERRAADSHSPAQWYNDEHDAGLK